MREILFRGKRTDNGDWVEGFIVASRENTYPNGFEMITVDGINYDELDSYIPDFISYAVDPSTVCQYTGLNDKNGKRIFEGDIVKAQDEILGSPFCDGMNGKVVYDEAAYFIELKDPMNSQWLYDECAVYEVIGNVHDNPELLEK